MANTLVQFRLDDASRLQATLICHKLGIDLQTYMRMCIARLISNNGIPFDMVLENNPSNETNIILELQRISKENGNSEMTLDEINEEINLAREERDKKESENK